KCGDGTDCMSSKCDTTQTPAVCISCIDGVLNGDETDTDCGGSCSPCGVGNKCNKTSDCVSMEGTNKKGTACSNMMKDGDETDTDCGGSCTPCAVGKACMGAGDCQGGNCAANVCCDNACSSQCQSCVLPGHKGACTNIPSGVNGFPSCGAGNVCDG